MTIPSPQQALERIAEAFSQHYVYPQRGEALAQHLRVWSKTIRLPKDESEFAETVTAEIQRHTPDRHIRVVTRLPSAPSKRHATAAGIRGVQILNNNIGLLEVHGFSSQSAPALDAAMTLLAGTKALVLDFRQHRGGESDIEAYFLGYFFAEANSSARSTSGGNLPAYSTGRRQLSLGSVI